MGRTEQWYRILSQLTVLPFTVFFCLSLLVLRESPVTFFKKSPFIIYSRLPSIIIRRVLIPELHLFIYD